MQQKTIPANTNQEVTGYIVNTGLSAELYQPIRRIQANLKQKFGDAVWVAPQDSLHITLMDWLAPLVDYGQNKDDLFGQIKNRYTNALANILANQKPIKVAFNKIEAFPAAIIVKGTDNGSYQRIREEFLKQINLLPGTKAPPKIIHSTICKFLKQINFGDVEDFIKSQTLQFEEEITHFRLIHERQMYMVDHRVLQRFTLR